MGQRDSQVRFSLVGVEVLRNSKGSFDGHRKGKISQGDAS